MTSQEIEMVRVILYNLTPSHRAKGCWCSSTRNIEGFGHEAGCNLARAFLLGLADPQQPKCGAGEHHAIHAVPAGEEDMRGKVRIYSDEHGAYWRPEGKGYTSDTSRAGVWFMSDALSATAHCGPEKKIQFQDVTTGRFLGRCNQPEAHSQGAQPCEPASKASSQTKGYAWTGNEP